MPAGMITERYEYIAGNSRKFWECDYPSGSLPGITYWVARWGRIGTDGQSKRFNVSSCWQARSDAKDKTTGKILKGYRQVDQFSDPVLKDTGKLMPAMRVKLTPTPISAGPKPLDDTTKQIVITLLKAGHPDDKIAEFAQCKTGQVKAIRAHITMGKYDGMKPAGEPATSGKGLSSKALPSGKRRFNLK